MVQGSLTKLQILAYVATIDKFTKFTELQLNLGISDVALLNNLKELIKSQYLIKKGARRSARYKLTQKGYEAIRDYLIEIDYYLDAVKQTIFGDPCKTWEQLTDFDDYGTYLRKREVANGVILFYGGLKIEREHTKISDFVLQILKKILEDKEKSGIIKLIEIAKLYYDVSHSEESTRADSMFLYHLIDSFCEIPVFRAVGLKLRNMEREELEELLRLHSEQSFE